MSNLSPVCLFVFNRLHETQLTVEALRQNYLASETELVIFSDGSKNELTQAKVEAVRQYLPTITGFKSVEIIESPENKGLANSIISGVTQLLDRFGKVIVLEDDLITTPNFLNYMNQALEYYQNDQNIQSISGYSLVISDQSNEVYFQVRPGSWGWATWENRWSNEIFDKEKIRQVLSSDKKALMLFKLKCGADIGRMLLGSINNRNDSWYVRWAFDHFRKNHYSVFPVRSYVINIGHQADATHCKGINTYVSELVDKNKITTEFNAFRTPEYQTNRDFLYYFTRRYKLIFRIRLLKTREGRNSLKNEIKNRMGGSK
jgi:hypothetical protein